MSLSTASSVSLLLRMSDRKRACPGGSDESSSRPARPMMACTGVRTSWLTVASRLGPRRSPDLGFFLGLPQLALAALQRGLRALEPLLFEQPFARALQHRLQLLAVATPFEQQELAAVDRDRPGFEVEVLAVGARLARQPGPDASQLAGRPERLGVDQEVIEERKRPAHQDVALALPPGIHAAQPGRGRAVQEEDALAGALHDDDVEGGEQV